MSPPYAYYPGCSQTGTSMEYDISVRAVCRKLEIELIDIAQWSCCGSTPAHTVDHVLSAALAARNLILVEKMGLGELVTPCPSCLAVVKTAMERMEDPSFRKRVNALLEEPFEGRLEARSVLQIIIEDIGLDRIRKKVVKPLKGLVLAPYYGCLLNRPPKIMKFDDPENPTSIDRILEALGAEVPLFPFKVECCGAAAAVPDREVVMTLSHKLLTMAEEAGAHAVVVACPLCHQNLDLRQGQINSATCADHHIPVFYFSQLIGVAFGLGIKELGLEKHSVDAVEVLKRIQTSNQDLQLHGA